MLAPLTVEPADGADAVASDAFRTAMSRVASAVHVVATDGPGGRAGFTATAVVSVSVDPPTLLVCLHGESRVVPILDANGVFCVSTLAAAQEGVADAFAGRTGLQGEARFVEGRWDRLVTGAPALVGALAAFDCRMVESRLVATHRVLLGIAVAVRSAEDQASLVYRDRRYLDL